jgi:GMP reductase
MKRIPIELDYDDVYMVPKKCRVGSRSDCDISVNLGGRNFSNPVIVSNMPSVVDFDTCKYLANKNMFYVMHRFVGKMALYKFLEGMLDKYVSISIGVNKDDAKFFKDSLQGGIKFDYVTIDVAHAHSDRVCDTIKYIKDLSPETFVIAGNVASAAGVIELEQAGADCTKIFVGPGAACSTRVKTGFTRGTVTCLRECAQVATKPIIADGGIKEPGHIAKALACGATMVMAGFFMCGFDQNAGEMVLVGDNEKKYIYYGSASYNVKKKNHHVEGTQILVDYKGDMGEHIYDIECSLKSAVSYAGGKNLSAMRDVDMFQIRKK